MCSDPECLSTASTRAVGYELVPIVAASGFAGLGYEIVWMRELSLTLGSEMMAVLGAVAGFFAGLALGAFALDALIRRAASPRRAYAALEAVIGLWGVVSVWFLPWAGRALPTLLGSEPAPALLWAASFALPALALLPATAAMGGTLSALERMLTTRRRDARVSAGVYGANTAGAVAGTLASTFVLLPAFGLSGTLLCLAALNGACALGALALGPDEPRRADAEQAPARMAREWRLPCTLFVTGLLGILFEVLVVRLAAQVMQDTIYTFAGLLAVYLLGTAAGSLLWQRFGPRAGDAALNSLLAATALASLSTALLAPLTMRIADATNEAGFVGELAVAAVLFLAPSTAMGALFGHLAQRTREARGALGFAVGVNAVGAALAPLLAAQALVPTFGAWTALVLVSLAYLLLLPATRAALAWAVTPAAIGLILLLHPTKPLVRAPEGGAVLDTREGPMATASVVEDAAGVRYLEVNGRFRMGGTSSARSDYRQAMLPLLLHASPRTALFLGVGTGATLVGGARMPGVSVRGVELSSEVTELLPWFADPAAGVAPPPTTIADARRYVVADQGRYDVVVADLFHPALDGSGALYTMEHFAAIKRRLASGGLFCQWLPLYQLDAPSLQAIIRSFLQVYPDASAWLNHYSVRTPMLALIGRQSGSSPDLEALSARLGDPALGAVARPLGFETPIDLLGQFLAGPQALRAFAGEGPLNSDDYPFVTFDASRNVRALTTPPWTLLIAVTRALRPDPAEFLSAPDRDAFGARLSAYWRARNRFLEAGAMLPGEPRGRALIEAAAPGLLESLRLSGEFDPAYQPLMSMAQALMSTDPEAAIRLLRDIDRAAPSRSAARDMLARTFRE